MTILNTQLIEELTQGNTYEEYEQIFLKANLLDEDVNMEITRLIDFTICNIGAIDKYEFISIIGAIDHLIELRLDPEYGQVIKDVASHILDTGFDATKICSTTCIIESLQLLLE